MKELLEFIGNHPFLSIVLVWIVAYYIFVVFNRILRCINIAIRGYPTALYMDADGDIVHPKASEDSEL